MLCRASFYIYRQILLLSNQTHMGLGCEMKDEINDSEKQFFNKLMWINGVLVLWIFVCI